MPWQDRSGRTDTVRLGASVLAIAPCAWLCALAATNGLGPRPFTAAIHLTGDWSLRLLVATLAVSPLRRLMHWPNLIGARQVFGIAAAAYAASHLLLYTSDLRFDLARVLSEIVQRTYLGVGSIALIGLLILLFNSGAAAVARLGGAEWTRLHALVHPTLALALLHAFMQSKLDVSEPILLSGAALWAWGYRWLQRRGQTEPAALVMLALAATVGTLVIECAWYGLATRVTIANVISDLFVFDYEINEIWYVLSTSLALAAARFLLVRTGAVKVRPRQEPGIQGT